MAKRPKELREMRRFAELAGLARSRYPKDKYFDDLENSVRLSALARNQCLAYERAFTTLDQSSWSALRTKALAHFTHHREGQWKQGFFNQLNEAFAYRLLRQRGFARIKVLPELGKTTPDLEYFEGRYRRHCEVKTISISDEAIKRRSSSVAYNTYAIHGELSPQFIAKVVSAIGLASAQITAVGGGGLIFLNVHFDDFTLQHYSRYRRQLAACLNSVPTPNIYIKIGTAGRKFVAKGSIRRVWRP
jgi:hypothetical protein